jgi:two-component system CheB/CheR fusion protein
VRTVASGEEALEVAPVFAPDVVLLDVGLPLMNGFDVARRLRRLPETKSALIVAVTGYGREEDRRNSRESGIDLHLTKPVEPAALKAILAS